MLAQSGADPEVQALGQGIRQIVATHQGLLKAVDPLRLLDQVFHGDLGDLGAGVLQQSAHHVVAAALDQGVGDGRADLAATGDGQLVLGRALMDDLDQVAVAQQIAAHEDGFGDENVVACQFLHDVGRNVLVLGQLLGKAGAYVELDLAHQLREDVAHQRPFALRKNAGAIVEEVGDDLGQFRAAFERALAGQGKEVVQLRRSDVCSLSHSHCPAKTWNTFPMPG